MSMNEDQFVGTGKNLGGHVEQGFGRATGDVKTGVEGKINGDRCRQDVYGRAKDEAGTRIGMQKTQRAMRQGGCRKTRRRWKVSAQRYRKSAVYLGGCRARPWLVYQPHGQTFGLLTRACGRVHHLRIGK